jgi:hypothetical protein
MSENGLAIVDQPLAIMPVMAIQQAVERRAAMVEFVRQIMVKGTDYGIIPGTGDKPTLLKAGAEKLNTFFGLAPRFEVVASVEDWTGAAHDGEPFFNYHYRCTLTRGQQVAGQGEGSCNSWEKKYRYRTVFSNKATAEDKANGKLETRTGRGGRPYDVYVVTNPNPADIVNTLQKMAQKRALVAATLLAVNASEFFTQDVEDMAGFGDDIIDGQWMPAETLKDERQNVEPPKRKPVSKPAPADPDVGDGPGIDSDGYIGGAGGVVPDAGDPLFARTWVEFNRAFAEQHPHFTGPEHVFSTVQLIYGGVPSFMDVREQVPNALSAYADLRDGGTGQDDTVAKVRAEFGIGVAL